VLGRGPLQLDDGEQATRPAGPPPQRLGIHLYDLANISPIRSMRQREKRPASSPLRA
jgi:hypothetical protein